MAAKVAAINSGRPDELAKANAAIFKVRKAAYHLKYSARTNLSQSLIPLRPVAQNVVAARVDH
jgi:hypothetical protein